MLHEGWGWAAERARVHRGGIRRGRARAAGSLHCVALTGLPLDNIVARTHERCRDISPGFGVGQESVSRLEKRSDLLLSTLRGYVWAMV